MTWIYEKEPLAEIPEGIIGFVYLITNQANGMKYIGKKNFYFSKTKQVKGKKKRIKVESDWRDYYGSNKTLAEHVSLFGEDKFVREIVHLCKSKSEMNYYELREQMVNDVLLKEYKYYNSYVGTRINRKQMLSKKSVSSS
jgi:hypothetical protein